MAEALGIASGSLTVLELTIKVMKQCKALIETARDAPRELRHIFIEISSLKAVLESFDFLSHADYSATAQGLADSDGLVEGCRSTVEEIAKELDGLSLANSTSVATAKRQRIQGSLKWCLKESKTRKLLDETIQHKTTLTLALLGEVTSDVKTIKSGVKRIETHLNNEEMRKICDWIEHTNPTSIHNLSCSRHESHTCEWIQRVGQWEDWLHLRRRFIWIHGIPGAGKTVLASYLITQVKEHCAHLGTDRVACLYYYCSFRHGKEEHRDESISFIRWIISQLYRRSDGISTDILDFYQRNEMPSMKILKDALRDLLLSLDVLYIVCDAVDESNPREDLLGLIQDLVTHPDFRKIQLLATSRRYAEINEIFRPLSEPTLPMSNSIVDEDIRLCIESTMKRTKSFTKWSQQLRKDIFEALVEGAQGMFRWVVCQIDRLQRKSPQQAKIAIKQLPKTIEDTYKTILLEIPSEDWPVACMALQWICGHSRLSLEFDMPANCLASLAVMNGHIFPTDSRKDPHDHDFLETLMGCLIEVTQNFMNSEGDPWPFGHGPAEKNEQTRENTCYHTLAISHYTVQEFLFSDHIINRSVCYFAMSSDDCVTTMLETILEPNAGFNVSLLSPSANNAFEMYTWAVVIQYLWSCQHQIAQHNNLSQRHYEFFIQRRNLWKMNRSVPFLGEYDMTPACFNPTTEESMEDNTAMRARYLLVLLERDCLKLAAKFIETISLEPLLTIPISLQSYGPPEPQSFESLATKPGSVRFFDVLFHFYDGTMEEVRKGLADIMSDAMDSHKLLSFVVSADTRCISWVAHCMIERLLDRGAHADPSKFSLTPLQIAVQNFDLAAVEILFQYGIDPNEVGYPRGFAPAYMDTSWAQSSPLYIIRNAEYAVSVRFYHPMCNLIQISPLTQPQWEEKEEYVKRKRSDRSKIEALLLEKGAKDFVISRSKVAPSRRIDVRHLLD